MKCRHCGTQLEFPLVDLQTAPPSNAYLTKSDLDKPERWFPLRVLVCESCWLVQTQDFANANELFDENYAYFSSFSTTWVSHAERYADQIVDRMGLNFNSQVIEVAANDGYLLQFFLKKNIPCLGIEPTASTAQHAIKRGIPVIQEFFGESLSKELVSKNKSADLMIANNVLAHVPDINDFVKGFATLLKLDGIATFEFPHLINMIDHVQFDTIYHEHFSYLSLSAVKVIFEENGLNIFDVEEVKTHGGSLRVFAQRLDSGKRPVLESVKKLLEYEIKKGIQHIDYYKSFQERTNNVKYELLDFLLKAKRSNSLVLAYGAAAKGNTLLNYAGIKSDFITYVVDQNPSKQNKYLPGSRIPIVDETIIRELQPEYILILPWNLANEVKQHLGYVRSWGGKFVTAVPSIHID